MPEHVTTITAKGQVTIPKAIREALQVDKGDRLLFVLEGDRLVLVPIRKRPLRELCGALPATRPFPGQEAVRQEARARLGERMEQGEE